MRSHLNNIRYHRVMGYRDCLGTSVNVQVSNSRSRLWMQTFGFPFNFGGEIHLSQ